MSRLSSRPVLNILRGLAAIAGTSAWVYWWVATGPRTPPQTSGSVWIAALLLWGCALFEPWKLPRPSRATALAALAISLSLVPRLSSLRQVPYGITTDEIIDQFIGLEVLRVHPWDLFTGVATWYFERPYLTSALQAWPCLFLDPLLGARLASVILGLASLLSTYALTARLFGTRTACLAVTVLGCSYWHIAYSRMGYPYIQPMFLVPCALHVLCLGVAKRNRFLQFVGGVVLGLILLAYTPARIVIPVAALWCAHRVVVGRTRLREAVAVALVIGLGAALVLSPYLRSQGFQGFVRRYRESAQGPGGPLRLLAEQGWTSAAGRDLLAQQTRAAAQVYFSTGGMMSWEHAGGHPLLDRFSGVLIVIGLAGALVRPRDSRRFLLLVWIAATFITGQVLTDSPKSAYRAAPLLPAFAICAALGVESLTEVARRWLRIPESYLRFGGPLVVLSLVLPVNLVYLADYHRQRSHDVWASITRLVGDGPIGPVYYLIGPEPLAEYYVMRFLAVPRVVRDAGNLMDVLQGEIDPARDAVFVMHPTAASAAQAIQRCYPGATLLSASEPAHEAPVIALAVSRTAIHAGGQCAGTPQGPGLLARYFSGGNWDGAVLRERIESWPYSYRRTTDRFGSVEWSGVVQIPVAGDYRFRLWPRFGATGTATVGTTIRVAADQEATARFEAGEQPVVIRCRSDQPTAFCWLHWETPGGPLQLIPPQFLRPTAAGAPGAAPAPAG